MRRKTKDSFPRKATSQGEPVEAASVSLEAEVQRFERENPGLLEAMRLFDMSQAAYERALLSQTDWPVRTGTSTEPYVP